MKQFLITITLTIISFFCFFHLYYAIVSIARVNYTPVESVAYPHKLIEEEKSKRQELKKENEELKKKLEEAKILIQTWEKKEKHCDDLQYKYNQIYLITNQ